MQIAATKNEMTFYSLSSSSIMKKRRRDKKGWVGETRVILGGGI